MKISKERRFSGSATNMLSSPLLDFELFQIQVIYGLREWSIFSMGGVEAHSVFQGGRPPNPPPPKPPCWENIEFLK